MEKQEIIDKLYLLASKLGRMPHKNEINAENGFTIKYTTMVNRGVTLNSLNFKEYLYYENSNTCSQCKKELTFAQKNNKYCSKSCAGIVNGTIAPKRISKYLGKNCNFCFVAIKRKEDFCSMKCRNNFLYMNRFLDWYYNKGDFTGSALLIKGYITMMVGYKCSECGISTYNNKPLTLHLEHKDGNAINNSRENLCLLCPNCHALTPTYGARNIGNGKRTWRKERYHAGKSY